MKKLLFLLMCLGFSPSDAAFFNIKKSEKNRMISCGMYLYLKKTSIDCDNVTYGLTEEMYKDFITMLQRNSAGEQKNFDNETIDNDTSIEAIQRDLSEASISDDPIPAEYKDFKTFKESITKICTDGKMQCEDLREKNIERKGIFKNLKRGRIKDALKRQKCNTYCSAKTCKDLFTIAACYGMYEAGICKEENVINCFEKNKKNTVDKVHLRGWPQSWANLEENWQKIFLATASEPAKGKHLGLRFAQFGAAAAGLAALPFVVHIVAPAAAAAVFVHAGTFVQQYLVASGVRTLKDKASDVAQEKIKEKYMKKMGKYVDLKNEIIQGCFCQCPTPKKNAISMGKTVMKKVI